MFQEISLKQVRGEPGEQCPNLRVLFLHTGVSCDESSHCKESETPGLQS